MIKDALEYIVDLKKPITTTVGGLDYSTEKLLPLTEPTVEEFCVKTLRGFADFVNDGFGYYENGEKIYVHVQNALSVRALGAVFGSFKQREAFCCAMMEPVQLPVGRYINIEEFIIKLQSHFVQDSSTAELLRLVGNIKKEDVTNWSDDGVSQSVTARKGIALVEKVLVPNPVMLRPYKTFLEIEQPVMPFVFRVKERDGQMPDCGLFQSECGIWEIETIGKIKEWLMKEITWANVVFIG